MDFSFSPEQQELQTQVRAFLDRRFTPQAVALLADSESGWDMTSWQEVADLGWLGVSVPESEGGAGLTFLEEAILLEEFGRCLYAGPFLATIGLARPGIPGDRLAEVAAGTSRWSVAFDSSHLVPNLQAVESVLWIRDEELWEVGAAGAAAPSIDPTRRMGRLVERPEGRLLASGAPAAKLAANLRTRRNASLALESVGLAQRVLEWGIEHARTREQFGRPIGSYQAVAHPLVDSYVEVELARSLAYWAAWCISVDHPAAGQASLAAVSSAVEAAVHSCERVIQVHGGMGFTWESPLHRYYKRALWAQYFGGAPARRRTELARSLLLQPETAQNEGSGRFGAGQGGLQS